MNPDEARLRPARPDDLELLYSARKAGFQEYVEAIWGWDEAQQRALAERELAELPYQIVESSTSVIGYLCVLHEPDHDDLDEIVVVPAWQRRGIGAALVRMLMDAAAGRGVPLRLSVLFNNDPARRLYERLGFRVTRVEHPRVKMEWP